MYKSSAWCHFFRKSIKFYLNFGWNSLGGGGESVGTRVINLTRKFWCRRKTPHFIGIADKIGRCKFYIHFTSTNWEVVSTGANYAWWNIKETLPWRRYSCDIHAFRFVWRHSNACPEWKKPHYCHVVDMITLVNYSYRVTCDIPMESIKKIRLLFRAILMPYDWRGN
jgi:hypothetical protein